MKFGDLLASVAGAGSRLVALLSGPAGWRGAAAGVHVLTAGTVVAFVCIQVLPTGNARAWLGFGWMSGLLLGAGLLAHGLLRGTDSPAAPLRRALLVYGPWVVALASWYAGALAALFVVAVLLDMALAGAVVAALLRRPPRALAAVLGVSLSLPLLRLAALVRVGPAEQSFPAIEERCALALPDPGAAGPHGVQFRTYGTGHDRQRPEYGADVDVVSESVDGSRLVAKWAGISGALRTSYWGFDSHALPLQARVWLPALSERCPVVMIAHGDHAMEEPSEAGYDYLGQHLASRGFVVILVDQNFLNTSLADMTGFPLSGRAGLHGEHDLRAWLLLEHLALWRRWSADPRHPLGARADLNRVVLAGHSVGGEAAALASLFNQLHHYPDEPTVEFDYRFGIRGVLSLAGGDGYYLPRGQLAQLGDVSYLALHGSKDAQATSFGALAPAARTPIASEQFRFFASTYVVGATHDQFNADWGTMDVPDFWGWAVDTRHTLTSAEQRRLARVYFGAFAEALLHDEHGYVPFFADPRVGAKWLPSVHYVPHYIDSSEVLVATFDEDHDLHTTTLPGGRIDVSGARVFEEWLLLKRSPLGTHALRVDWDSRGAPRPRITIELPADFTADADELVLSLAASEENDRPIDLTIELGDAHGSRASVPLSRDQLLYPQVRTRTRWPVLEGRDTDEPILRRYHFPLAAFHDAGVDIRQPRRIELVLDRSQRGGLILDNVGFAQQERAAGDQR